VIGPRPPLPFPARWWATRNPRGKRPTPPRLVIALPLRPLDRTRHLGRINQIQFRTTISGHVSATLSLCAELMNGPVRTRQVEAGGRNCGRERGGKGRERPRTFPDGTSACRGFGQRPPSLDTHTTFLFAPVLPFSPSHRSFPASSNGRAAANEPAPMPSWFVSRSLP